MKPQPPYGSQSIVTILHRQAEGSMFPSSMPRTNHQTFIDDERLENASWQSAVIESFRWTARLQSGSFAVGHEIRGEVISRRWKYDHISDVQQDLHWLWVPQGIDYNTQPITIISNGHLHPGYLGSRHATVVLFFCQQSDNVEVLIRERTFSFTGRHAWNNLPQIVKSSASVAVFIKHLNTSFQTML